MRDQIDIISSFNGFHNPYKHAGMTPKEFMRAYMVSLSKKFIKKKRGKEYRDLAVFILRNWEKALQTVAELFPNTLKSKGYLQSNGLPGLEANGKSLIK